MAEPSLYAASRNHTLVAYRFLWLRTFHDPIAIRLMIQPNGTDLLTGKITSGHGGYETGVVSQTESVEVSREQVRRFVDLLQKSAFWSSATEGGPGGNDGAQWILEGLQGGTYHIVDRWSPEAGEYHEACLYLVGLSGIKVDAKELY